MMNFADEMNKSGCKVIIAAGEWSDAFTILDVGTCANIDIRDTAGGAAQ